MASIEIEDQLWSVGAIRSDGGAWDTPYHEQKYKGVICFSDIEVFVDGEEFGSRWDAEWSATKRFAEKLKEVFA